MPGKIEETHSSFTKPCVEFNQRLLQFPAGGVLESNYLKPHAMQQAGYGARISHGSAQWLMTVAGVAYYKRHTV